MTNEIKGFLEEFKDSSDSTKIAAAILVAGERIADAIQQNSQTPDVFMLTPRTLREIYSDKE